MLSGLLPVLSLIVATTGAVNARYDNFLVRSQLSTVPPGFRLHSEAVSPDHIVQLSVALSQAHIQGLHAAIFDISNPRSERYRRHLSKSEVERLVAPSQESVKAVTEWLHLNNITTTTVSPAGDILTIRTSATQANRLLDANFTSFIHEQTNTTMLRTLSYSLPVQLHGHISFIYPTTDFIPPIQRIDPERLQSPKYDSRATAKSAACANVVTPQCLQAIYNIPTTPASAVNNSMYVSGFGGNVANHEDLKTFLSQYRPDIKNNSYEYMAIDQAISNASGSSTEGNCDIQYAVGLATNVPVTFLNTGSQIVTQDLMEEVRFLLAEETPPLVLTTSYVFEEPSDPNTIAMVNFICQAYGQLGARGTSIIFASGDSGVAGGFIGNPADCGGEKPFVPTFPSTCPYVTSVGATQGLNPEIAAPFTSGGFSNIFTRPSYQDTAVNAYLTSPIISQYAGRVNTTGRAFPDVAAQGVNYLFIANGQSQSARGTSMAAPVFASIVALLNDRLLTEGKPPLGFLNPMLYDSAASAGVFNDITEGNNPGCGTDGFEAMAGWDPVSGLGTPDFDKLLAAVGGVVPVQNEENGAAGKHRLFWYCYWQWLYVFVWTLTMVFPWINRVL